MYWSQLVLYRKQLAVAAAAMRDISSWWWLLYCWQRWRRLVDVMQGQRGGELQQLVQLRACLGWGAVAVLAAYG